MLENINIRLHMNLTLIYSAAWEQMLESINISNLGQTQNNDLNFSHVFTNSTICTNFQFIDVNSLYKIWYLNIFTFRSIKEHS